MATSKTSLYFSSVRTSELKKKPFQTAQVLYLNLIYSFYFQHKSASFN